MSDELYDDDGFPNPEIGECDCCHQQCELVATLTASARLKDGTAKSVDLNLCENCARKSVEDMAPLAHSIELHVDEAEKSPSTPSQRGSETR